MSDADSNIQHLRAIDSLIERDPRLQPTLDNEALQEVLRDVLRDLRSGKTRHPAEAISRALAYGGLMGYSGPVLIRGGGYINMPGYQEWWDGLSLPPMLLDQAFAVVSMGRDWVFREIDKVRDTPEAGGQLPRSLELLRSSVEEASMRLRLDASGLGALNWFVDEQLKQGRSIHYDAGLVASLRLYVQFCTAVAAEGFKAGGMILVSPR